MQNCKCESILIITAIVIVEINLDLIYGHEMGHLIGQVRSFFFKKGHC